MLSVAKILKSHGTDGGVLAGLRRITPGEIDIKEPVFIEFDGLPVPFFIERMEPKGTDKLILHLNDVSNLEDAEELVGKEIFLDAELEEEEEPDFVGWTVLDRGKTVGKVADYEPIPGNLCLYVDAPSGRVMIPLHEDLILAVDSEKKIVDLDIPSGLY